MKNKRIIKKNHEFQAIIAKNKSIANSNFILYFDENHKNDGLRYGISVGKKIGNAVVRNNIKRQVRMMIKDLLPEYGELNQSIILLIRKRYTYKTFAENEKALASSLKELQKKK